MKISVAKRDLDAALQVVSNSMSGTEMELSSQFVFRPLEGEKGKAEVLTFSGRLFSSCPFVAEIKDGAGKAFTIEGARLKQWLRSVSDASLEFEFDEATKVVTTSAPRGSQEFRSLDPQAFPYWDDLIEDLDVTATIEAGRFIKALEFARLFVADTKLESTSPQHCVTEVRDGAFLSNDKRGGSMAQVKGLEKAALRVFTSDMGAILKFLGTLPPDGLVEVLEHPKGFLLRRKDGAVFGETKYQAAFPKMLLPMELNDQWWWGLPRDELKSAILFLMSGAAKGDNRLYFSRPDTEGPVIIGMMSLTGSLKTLEIDPVEWGQQQVSDPNWEGEGDPEMVEANKPFPEFQLSVTCLQKVLGNFDSSVIRFGINARKGAGFVRFRQDHEGDKFLVALPWLRV